MDGHGRDEVSRRSYNNNNNNQIRTVTREEEEESLIMDHDEEVKRGPWTVEEDFTLINYVAHHGEGRWNSLARCAGLKRTGKSCRLRWLNYLRPDVRRGNITLEEQLLILELHSRWGNRWSKIAQHLPGRTDNEIKNYWRTRVQKHAKQLKCDVNSKQFKDAMRYLWMPRLIERIQVEAAAANKPKTTTNSGMSRTSSTLLNYNNIPAAADHNYNVNNHLQIINTSTSTSTSTILMAGSTDQSHIGVSSSTTTTTYAPPISSTAAPAVSSDSNLVSDLTESNYSNYTTPAAAALLLLNDHDHDEYHGGSITNNNNNINQDFHHQTDHDLSSTTTAAYFNQLVEGPIHAAAGDHLLSDHDYLWDINIDDDIWFLHR